MTQSESFVSSSPLARHLHMPQHLPGAVQTGSVILASLTRRQREVLSLLCLRLTDAEIAHSLAIGTRTAESHGASILAKLGARNRREAAAIVRSLELAH